MLNDGKLATLQHFYTGLCVCSLCGYRTLFVGYISIACGLLDGDVYVGTLCSLLV